MTGFIKCSYPIFFLIHLSFLLFSLSSCSNLSFLKEERVDPIAKVAEEIRQNSGRDISYPETGSKSDHCTDPNSQEFKRSVQAALYLGQLIVGMDKTEVIQAWGKPHQVRTTGDLSSGNEEWVYTDHPSALGNAVQLKSVFFETGRVAGWQIKKD